MTKPQKKPRARNRKATTAPSSTEGPPCLIVGMGASAGGLKAFKAFFSRMPVDTCMAFVLVPHLDPTHESLMHELLAKQTAMPVGEAEQGGKVKRGHVYIIPPGKYLTISQGVLHLSKPPEARGAQTVIDHFLRSLATDQQEHAIGIILSGTGSHGALGIKEIKLAGGLVMVQQPQSAEYEQMPRSAIDTGRADYVLPPEQMPEALVKYANHPYALAESAAEARSRLFATVLHDSNDAVTVQDLDGRITAWNRGAEHMYGYSEAEALDMNIRDTVPADRRGEALELVKRIAAGEDIRSFETQRLTRDGHALDVWLTVTRVNDAAGMPVALATMERDITGIKQAREALQQLNQTLEQRVAERTAELQHREQEFHTLADNVPALFSYLDADQRYRYVNHRYEEHWKRPAAEIIGRTAEELLGPAGYALARPHIDAVLAGQPVIYEAEFDFADCRHSMQVRLVPDIDATGRVQGFYTLVNDITELKQAESALREREERLRVILNTAPDAIITIGADGIVQSFNQAAEAIFGYSASEVMDQNVSLLMPSPYREAHDGYLARYLRTRKSDIFGKRREVRGRRKDGSTFPMELTVSEIDREGLFVGIARDLSARRELEREVIEASTLEQERIGQELHDGLGQRLTGLSLMVESLRQALNKQQLPKAATVAEIIEQLKKATGETRAIAHGLVPVPLTERGLSDALRKLARDTQTATGIRCRFTTRSRADIEVTDRAVALQLYRIAQELIHNAVRHAQAGRITLGLNRKDRRLELLVSDDGKGFYSDGGKKEGYGLRIMRYRAAMIGCELTIESAVGKGTVACCTLPLPA
jgi:two-component system sensor kinase FixL